MARGQARALTGRALLTEQTHSARPGEAEPVGLTVLSILAGGSGAAGP